jgi:hypothetical protein
VLWAFGIALGPQIAGADREFLRMELRLREINVLTVVQKATVLLGTIGVALFAQGNFAALAAVAVLGPVASALLARRETIRVLVRAGASAEGLRVTYSFWNHLAVVSATWVRTMDLFFLGMLRVPARELGLYGAASKVANLATALPVAAANLFCVWIGRRAAVDHGEKRAVMRMSAWLLVASAAAAVLLWFVVPVLIPLLSHGRWTSDEAARLEGWTVWLLASATLFAAPALVFAWLGLRTSYVRLVLEVSLPWTLLGLVAYPVAVHVGGSDAAALCSVVMSAVFVALAWARFRRAQAGTAT